MALAFFLSAILLTCCSGEPLPPIQTRSQQADSLDAGQATGWNITLQTEWTDSLLLTF